MVNLARCMKFWCNIRDVSHPPKNNLVSVHSKIKLEEGEQTSVKRNGAIGKEQGMVDAVLYALIKPGGDFTYTSAIMDGCFNTFAIRAAENHVV
ncbi:hypothetical protein RB195_026491 [Necator americanus]|uniref:Uncharacterized protein n=1 Tax=Necator americanus TaxID=51031 RepID=A0ABR1EX46_NECAM